MTNDTVNYRLLDNLIEDVVTQGGYSQTLHDALHVVSTISRGACMVLQPEQMDGTLLRAGLFAGMEIDDIIED